MGQILTRHSGIHFTNSARFSLSHDVTSVPDRDCFDYTQYAAIEEVAALIRRYCQTRELAVNLLKPTGHVMQQQFNLLATDFFFKF